MTDSVAVHTVRAGRRTPLDATMRRTALVIGLDTVRRLRANLSQRLAYESFRVFIAGPDVTPLIEAARTLAARGIDVVAVVADTAVDSEITALFEHADAAGTLELVVFDQSHELLNSAVRRWKAAIDDTSSHAIGPIVGAQRSFSGERDLHATRG